MKHSPPTTQLPAEARGSRQGPLFWVMVWVTIIAVFVAIGTTTALLVMPDRERSVAAGDRWGDRGGEPRGEAVQPGTDDENENVPERPREDDLADFFPRGGISIEEPHERGESPADETPAPAESPAGESEKEPAEAYDESDAAAADELPTRNEEPRELSPDELFARSSPSVVRVVGRTSGEGRVAIGSGFIVDPDGLVVTNHHVIEPVEEVFVLLESDERLSVEGVVAVNPKVDLAILRVARRDLPALSLADGDPPRVGTRVFAIGSPQGLTSTLSDGLVSGLRPFGTDVKVDDLGLPERASEDGSTVLIQTTAAISPGSSGGPLLRADGRVVGVTTAFLAGGQNLNFAVPAGRVRELLENLTDPVPVTSIERRRPRVSLPEAALLGDERQVESHLEQDDVDPDEATPDEYAFAAMHLAAREGHAEIVRMLLEAGATVDARSGHDLTPLAMATYRDHVGIARLLIDAGADVDARDEAGNTPLHGAVIRGSMNVARVLLEHEADVNAAGINDYTPLYWAATMDSIEMARLLLQNGADPEQAAEDGTTPLDIAVHKQHREMVRLLRRYRR